MADPEPLIPQWSRRVRPDAVGTGTTIELVPDDSERAALAGFLQAISVDGLTATITVKPWLDGVRAEGRWAATVTQTCSVSLDAFASEVSGRFDVSALPADSPHMPALEPEAEFDLSTPDPPDVLDPGGLDVAALVAEDLSLELGYAPRKPGVEFTPPEEQAVESPFAALARLGKQSG